jgi:hypothetical protein
MGMASSVRSPVRAACTSLSSATRSVRSRSQAAARQQGLARDHVAQHPQDLVPHIRLQAIERQDHAALSCQALPQSHRIGQAQPHQLLVAVQQHPHAALGDRNSPLRQQLVDLGHTALLTRPLLADEGNDVEAELALGQRPGPGFFRDHRPRILRAGRVHTLPDSDGQAPEPVEAYDRAMVMIGHPHALPTRAPTRAAHTRCPHRVADSGPLAPAWPLTGSRDVPLLTSTHPTLLPVSSVPLALKMALPP